MKKYKVLSRIFTVLAILLSDIMCAAVAYNYCNLQWNIRCAGFSAPASVAFLLMLPYGAGILICILLSRFFHQKSFKAVSV